MHPTLAHLQRELERLDLLLHREVLRLRARYQLSLDEFRGLYVSDAQVDALLRKTASADAGAITEQAEAMYARNQSQMDTRCSWASIASEFNIEPFEQDVLLLALAPELDLKYETLYGYLNNDVTRKWPTRDLSLRVLSPPEDRIRNWERLAAGATLFRSGLLQPVAGSPDRASLLAGGFSPAPALARYLISGASTVADPPLKTLPPANCWDTLHVSAQLKSRLLHCAGRLRGAGQMPIMVLEGSLGSGRQIAARLVSTEVGRPAFSLNVRESQLTPDAAAVMSLTVRLAGGTLFLRNVEGLFDSEGRPLAEGLRFFAELAGSHALIFLACAPGTHWRDLLIGRRHLAFAFGPPECELRRELWRRAAASQGLDAEEPILDGLAQRFEFTPGQIEAAAQQAADLPSETVRESLFAAARRQSDQHLGKLAVKVASSFDWDDLILPPATFRSVREAAQAIENRHKVTVEWGMRPGSAPGSLNILFSGPSGTGKTMTAGIIARHLGVELYRCDLSGIVSKYIGETEKNLDRIFTAARQSNAILFFDEADALFGKRSDVKDAHDRYANIEVSYLLQKMEQHDGVVILASNLSNNIDDAFARRIQYVVEFPPPTEVHRERLWRSMFSARSPVGTDVDFPFLARQFKLTGGQIRNITVDAAFLAAADGQRITMPLVVKAIGRHLLKTGRIPAAVEFKEYFSLLTEKF
jgi:hypothetical protein